MSPRIEQRVGALLAQHAVHRGQHAPDLLTEALAADAELAVGRAHAELVEEHVA